MCSLDSGEATADSSFMPMDSTSGEEGRYKITVTSLFLVLLAIIATLVRLDIALLTARVRI